MMTEEKTNGNSQLHSLCSFVKECVSSENYYQKCKNRICEMMGKYPSAPEPHNLLGIIMEIRGDHFNAMKHFRAACALDPSYLPATYNLNKCSSIFCNYGNFAYDENDCPVKVIISEKGEKKSNSVKKKSMCLLKGATP